MTALPVSSGLNAVRDVVRRLSAVQPGPYRVVSCYLKLEPRDKTRGKYLIKMKNRVRDALATLEQQPLDRAVRDSVAADLQRVRRHFEEPGGLPASRGIALFACQPLGLFEVVALPHVHRSRLGVEATPLVRELLALEQEFGTILVAACDRTGARFFEVTAFDVAELPSLTAGATRAGKFHGGRQARRGGVLAGGAVVTTPTSRTISTRSTRSARSPGSWWPASAWMRRPWCRTSTPTSTICCSAS